MRAMILTLFVVAVFGTGCSQQWREVNADIDSQAAYDAIDRVTSGVRATGISYDANLLGDLLDDPTANIYYSESGIMGPASSVFSFHDLNWFGLPGLDVFSAGIEQVAIVFLDAVSSQGARYFALFVDAQGGNAQNLSYIGISEPDAYVINDEEFVTELPALNGSVIVLRSFDVSDSVDDALATNIKLSVFDIDASGTEGLVGQFSTLKGFGNN